MGLEGAVRSLVSPTYRSRGGNGQGNLDAGSMEEEPGEQFPVSLSVCPQTADPIGQIKAEAEEPGRWFLKPLHSSL